MCILSDMYYMLVNYHCFSSSCLTNIKTSTLEANSMSPSQELHTCHAVKTIIRRNICLEEHGFLTVFQSRLPEARIYLVLGQSS